MLSRRAAVVAPAAFISLLVGAGPVAAEAVEPVVVSGNNDGVISTQVDAPGAPGNQGGESVTSVASAISCTWTPDDTDNTVILQGASPGSDAAAAWQAGGRYYNVVCTDGSFAAVYVPPGSPAAGVPGQATPAELAQQAWNRLRLPVPGPQHNPTDALSNLATWWWVDGGWQPMSQRTSAGPVWALVTASPVRSVWDAGDGSAPLVCAGPGTPYDRSRPAEEQHTDCFHTYTRSSADQPQTGPDPNDRFFTVTVTVAWQVTWQGSAGMAGALPEIRRTTTFPLRVEERQTLVTGGAG